MGASVPRGEVSQINVNNFKTRRIRTFFVFKLARMFTGVNNVFIIRDVNRYGHYVYISNVHSKINSVIVQNLIEHECIANIIVTGKIATEYRR